MPADYEVLLEDSVTIPAPVRVVWELVSDVVRMPEWSPQVVSTRLRSGSSKPTLGATFTNRNVDGELEWTTHGEIVRYDVGREFAFRIEENWVVWSFRLRPSEEGILLTQRREAYEGISPLSLELTEAFMGGQEAFTRTLRTGMRRTLEGIRASALAAAAAGPRHAPSGPEA